MIRDYEGSIFLDSGVAEDRANNRPSNFHNFMHTPFTFSSDDYEVGLHEIQIPYTWVNLREQQYICAMSRTSCTSMYKIKTGCVYHVEDLVDDINGWFSSTEFGPQMAYDPRRKRVTSIQGKLDDSQGFTIYASETLARMLGFPMYLKWKEVLKMGPRSLMARETAQAVHGIEVCGNEPMSIQYTAPMEPSLHHQMPRLYVSTSIVKHVANTSTDMLRVIPVENNKAFGSIGVYTFDRPLFVPLAHSTFDRINIKITDSEGQEVNFTEGCVIAVLEIRKRDDIQ